MTTTNAPSATADWFRPSFADRVAVVTGASAGIGLATARALIDGGATVIVNARRAGRLDELVEMAPERVRPIAGDATEPELVHQMLDAALQLAGAEADLVVANAGRGLKGSPLDSDADEWDEVLDINTTAAARLMRAAVRRMLADVGEHKGPPVRPRDVVLLGSSVGRNLSPFSSFYGAAKAAAHMIAEAIRREAGPRGIRVTTIEPGVVATEFQDAAGYDRATFGEFMDEIGPVLTPEDVARTILFVCAHPAGVHVNEVMVRPTRQSYP
ncbi:MAG: SDR family NAD(P)-dependent oxidoreductase [Planctomycetota bacterium]